MNATRLSLSSLVILGFFGAAAACGSGANTTMSSSGSESTTGNPSSSSSGTQATGTGGMITLTTGSGGKGTGGTGTGGAGTTGTGGAGTTGTGGAGTTGTGGTGTTGTGGMGTTGTSTSSSGLASGSGGASSSSSTTSSSTSTSTSSTSSTSTSTSTSTSSTSSGTGGTGPGGCVTPADCPRVGSDCESATCVAGVCGLSFVRAGTPTATQTPGDCHTNECDGMGNDISVVDDTDVPVDNNPCTSDVCTNGVPSNPPLMAGTMCGTNLVCTAAGTCTGCAVAADCPGQDTACETRTCTVGVCGFSFTAQGTVTASQTPGDCRKNECDGMGNIVAVVDNTDVPVDGNPCTSDLCTNGFPSNPPSAAGTACMVSGGAVCDGNGNCVGCNVATDCPGQDTDCRKRLCTAGMCGATFTAAGTPTSMQTPGDCHKNVCDGMGNATSVVDNTDVPVDGNPCTSDLCTNGVPSNPPVTSGTRCSQGGGVVCNGTGMCVACLVNSDCPASGNPCLSPACSAGVCGTSPVAMGTPTMMQTPGDCRLNVCDGMGNIESQIDDADVPVDGNQCTADVCTAGVPSNPPLPARTACNQNGGALCDGSGDCVQCVAVTDCPATGKECVVAACTAGACGTSDLGAGTPTSMQTPGDCHKNECDGAGNVVSVIDNTDVPVDGNACTSDVCTSGVPSNPPLPAGTGCSQNGGVVCDGVSVCTQTIAVVRVGDGVAALSSTGAAAFIEQYYATGASLGAPLALPVVASGNNQPFSMSGSAVSEGELSRSVDGHHLSLAGYAVVPGTPAVASQSSALVNRSVARIDASLAVDTSTRLNTGFSGGNVRGVTSSDGTAFWASGTGNGNTGGVWYVTFQSTGGTQIIGQSGDLPGNARAIGIFGGQLYGTSASGTYQGVFSVGSGLPVAQATATMLPGMPTTSGPSPYSFVRIGATTFYVADDRAVASGGGLQKWTFDGTNWNLVATLNQGLTAGCRGVTGWATGTSVTLAASTADAATKVVVVVDDGSPAPAFSTIATAGVNEAYRGVALSPR